MIQFKDFAPRMIDAPGFFKGPRLDHFETAVADANKWIHDQGVEVVSVETVVLPNMVTEEAKKTEAPALGIGQFGSLWYQFVRVWYR